MTATLQTSVASQINHLRCRECGATYEAKAMHVCELCFGPLEVAYDYEHIKRNVSRAKIAAGPLSIWRYRDFLPVNTDTPIDLGTGLTPLIRADRLGRRLGLKNLYIKNDAVNMPTLSFKDRVVSVALTRAKELGFTTVSCAVLATWPTLRQRLQLMLAWNATSSFHPIWKLARFWAH